MVTTQETTTQASLARQANHWLLACERLASLDHLASPHAWQGLQHATGTLLKESMRQRVREVVAEGQELQQYIRQQYLSAGELKNRVLRLRARYLKAEETIHFFTIAINSRTTEGVSALLRACDILSTKSMEPVLQPLGQAVPPVLTYVDKGVGAAILKAGLRLWDGKISPVAAIKITQHNLFRPTAIIHETGHQIAHILNWNEELAELIRKKMNPKAALVGEVFASWASEMAADAYAFVHAGYASVAALHDVVSGSPAMVFAYRAADPHPISYVRVLLNIQCCRQAFGAGPWDELENCFTTEYSLERTAYPSVNLIRLCLPYIPTVADLLINHPFRAFNNQALSRLVNPQEVSPRALEKLVYLGGPALFQSHAWIWKEALRLLALNGYQIAKSQDDLSPLYRQQEDWMTRLGYAISLN